MLNLGRIKFFINYGRGVFSLETPPERNEKGEVDMGRTLDHVKNIVGKEAHVQPA